MTKPKDDVPRSTAVLAMRSSASTARQDTTERGDVGLTAPPLERRADATGRASHPREAARQDRPHGAWSQVKPVPPTIAGVPSRRAVLATLLGLGVVGNLPAVSNAAANATPGGDAGLIALAAETEILAARFWAAVAMLVVTDTKLDELDLRSSAAFVRRGADLDAIEERHNESPFAQSGPRFVDVSPEASRDNGQAGSAAREAAHPAAALLSRRRAALRSYDRTSRRVAAAALALAGSEACSGESVAAKARACALVFAAYGNCDPPWLSDLVQSTLRDVVAIDGLA